MKIINYVNDCGKNEDSFKMLRKGKIVFGQCKCVSCGGKWKTSAADEAHVPDGLEQNGGLSAGIKA